MDFYEGYCVQVGNLTATRYGVLFSGEAINQIENGQIPAFLHVAKDYMPILAAMDEMRFIQVPTNLSDLERLYQILLSGLYYPGLSDLQHSLIRGLEHIRRTYAECLEWAKPKRRANAQKSYAGFIYLLKATTGHYKIGRTKDLNARTSALAGQLPFEVELIHSIATQDMIQSEGTLHLKFSQKRTNGEWFFLNDDDVSWIKSLKDLTGAEQW